MTLGPAELVVPRAAVAYGRQLKIHARCLSTVLTIHLQLPGTQWSQEDASRILIQRHFGDLFTTKKGLLQKNPVKLIE